MKRIDGIALLQKIKTGELKSETKIRVYYDDGMEEYLTTIYFDGRDLKWQPKTFHVRYFYDEFYYFEIIEERPEEIEELTLNGKSIMFGSMEGWLDFPLTDNEQKICNAIETIVINQNKTIKVANYLLKKEDDK